MSLQTCAQVLLTLNNLSDRGPYLNARNTFQELLAYDTVPIVNENDTIAVEEIRFGDNDTLSSQVLPTIGSSNLGGISCILMQSPRGLWQDTHHALCIVLILVPATRSDSSATATPTPVSAFLQHQQGPQGPSQAMLL